MDIYNEIIMTYAKESPNKFIMKNFTIKHKEQSRVCGDDIEVFLEIKKNKIENFSFI
jgi:NifU-like protein involved in Fe-S cluster formation